MVVALASLALLVLAGCDFFNSSLPTYRYRLTIEVDTPQGLRTGSSVAEVHTTKQGTWNIDSPGVINSVVFGEAVAVDLPNGQTLFAVLSDNWSMHIGRAFEASVPPTGVIDLRARTKAMRADRALRTLPDWSDSKRTRNDPGIRIYPLLVRFRDIADPASVEEVPYDNLAASFGEGYALRRMTVQRTRDRITTGIEQRLPWLEDLRNRHVRLNGSMSGAIMNDEPSNTLSASSFQRLKNR